MALNRIQAARVLSDKEMDLFQSSLADHAGELSDREISANIRRLRTQRDKQRDLLQRQRVATQARTGTKGGLRGNANDRTRQKADAFAEALQRLERQQQRREAARSRSSRSSGAVRAQGAGAAHGKKAMARPALPGRSAKAPAKRPGRAGDGPRAAAQAPGGLAQQKRLRAAGQQRTLAHVSSRNRRSQARRDSH